jgi:heptaprenyl diphosphate synthase
MSMPLSAEDRQSAAEDRQPAAEDRQSAAEDQQAAAGDRQPAAGDRQAAAEDRQSAAEDRQSAAEDRQSAAGDRSAARGTGAADWTVSSEWRLAAFLAALAFFLSTIEYMLPRPIPFMRLGLANLPLLFAVDLLSFGPYMVLAAVKVIGMSLLTGSLFSYVAVFSLVGTLASALTMRAARAVLGPRQLSYIGLCILGAMASNITQVGLARIFIFGSSAVYMMPAFMGLGLLSGLILGVFAQAFAARSSWLARVRGECHFRRGHA